jgi:hypothetical protein
VNVLVIPEDHTKDWLILEPILQTMMKKVGKATAKLRVNQEGCKGVSAVTAWDFILSTIEERRQVIDLFLLIVDRDGVESRAHSLASIEEKAQRLLSSQGKTLFAECACQEVEAWIIAGHEHLPKGWKWQEIQEAPDVKELYYLPFARAKGMLERPHEGRGGLARQADYKRIQSRCLELRRLEERIREWLGS